MIISASRRTDIPAFYSEWFINRLKEGYVLVRNPFNTNQVSKVRLTPDVIDCIVFWTKNPSPLINRLREIDKLGYKYYFQFTVTSYDHSIEKKVPTKKIILKTFRELSDKIGNEKVIWRYDPILLSNTYDIEYHKKWFKFIAESLSGYTHKCIISFIDMYKKCERNLYDINIVKITDDIKKQIAMDLSKTAQDYGIVVESCAETLSLSNFGINHGKCIDDQLISKIIKKNFEATKDKTQRHECGCISSIDIGSYNTCKHECKYCYANFSIKAVENNCAKHDIHSPLITGRLKGNEIITERKVKSLISRQLLLFR